MKFDLTELHTKYAGAADPALGHIPNDLIAAIQDVYKPAGMQLTESCPRLCLDQCSLDPCDVPCQCAYVREVLQIIREWKADTARIEAVN